MQGAIVGTGAILPGVSGGVLCVAFGIYEPMMALLSHTKKAFKDYYKMFIPFLIGWVLIYMGLYEPTTSGIASLNFAVIFPLLIGLIITVILFARIVNSLFEKHYALVLRIILGIVISSSLKIVPNNFENITILVISLICFVIGFIIARYMDILSNKQNNKE